jgi:hypothetical protein
LQNWLSSTRIKASPAHPTDSQRLEDAFCRDGWNDFFLFQSVAESVVATKKASLGKP